MWVDWCPCIPGLRLPLAAETADDGTTYPPPASLEYTERLLIFWGEYRNIPRDYYHLWENTEI